MLNNRLAVAAMRQACDEQQRDNVHGNASHISSSGAGAAVAGRTPLRPLARTMPKGVVLPDAALAGRFAINLVRQSIFSSVTATPCPPSLAARNPTRPRSAPR